MLIDRTNAEDISMLDLLVSKLEESMSLKGIKFFDYSLNELEICEISTYDAADPYKRSQYDCPELDPKVFKPGPIKRVRILFDSKADFSDRYSLDKGQIADDGIYTGSFLHIEWDYITSVFHIYIGANTYEKGATSTINLKKAYTSDCVSSSICLDFGLKYRREIRLIKVRLGKLYSSLLRDRQIEREAFARKGFTTAAVSAFPDLLDPLILGGSLNEERNDRRILSEGRSGQQDSNASSGGNIPPNKSI